FHALPLATLPLAVGAALVLAGRVGLGAAVALVALPMEEESALFLIGLGALLVVLRHWRLGLLVAGMAAVWLGVVVFLVMPGLHDPRTVELVEGNRTLHHFAAMTREPGLAVGRVFGPRGLDALVWLVLPTAGLALLAPRTLVIAVPTLLALLLQDRDDTFGRHWAAPLLVALWLATIAGLARLPKGTPRWIGLAAMGLGTALAFRLVSPFPGGGDFDAAALRYDERAGLLDRAISRIPPSASVIASQNVVAHLANRAEAYVFPIDSHYAEGLGWRRKRPDYYVLDLYDDLTNRAAVSERLNPLNADRPYHVWSAGHKVMVLSNAVEPPTVSIDGRYGTRLWLKGYDLVRHGNTRRLVLHWERYGQVRGRYDRELTVIDGRGERALFEADMPLSAQYGSNKWSLGQTILDEIVLPNAPGPLRVRVAWVAQDKRTPIRLADGAEAIELVLDVEP
ncbi:MAG: DUF2079 domain-containing protein, partial [Chloroflexi bacterium]|nr:DUF2079 domain-containing protein [Chloroflexota bacterium]